MSHVYSRSPLLAPSRNRGAILFVLTLTSATMAMPAQAAERVEISGHVAERCWATEASLDLSRPAARCSQGNLALSIRTRQIAETPSTAPRRSISKAADSIPVETTEQPLDRTAFEIVVTPTL